MVRRSVQFLVAFLIVFAALQTHAQAPERTPTKASKIAVITVTGARRFPTGQIIAASGLKPGDTVTAEQIQASATRLAGLGLFTTVNFRYIPKGDAITLEFQVVEAQTVPIWFDNFPWFTDDEIAAAIRDDVGLFTGDAPESGTLLDEITVVVEKLLSARKINGDVTHQLVASPIGDGMIMQFRVEAPALRIQSVQFGDSLASNSEKLKDRVPDLEGQPYSRFAIEVFENEQVRPLYASQGYLRAQIGPVQPRLVAPRDNPSASAVEVSIPIIPGPAYSWGVIQWQGNIVLPSSSLDGLIGITPGEVADGMKTDTAWQRIVAEYGHRGYLDAKVDPQPQFDETTHRVNYLVNIVEGPQYRMGEIIITGLSLDAEARLRHVWQLEPRQIFDEAYFEKLLPALAKPSSDVFGNLPVHYTEFGHLLRPNSELHTVDVLLDFK